MPQLITTKQQAQDAVIKLQQSSELAVDLECENNLHHYGMYISLIQISTRDTQYVFDMISLKELGKLQEILESTDILKVFHDVSFDLRILNYQYNCKPKYIRDTKLAATFLKKNAIGLKELLQTYFGIEKEKKFQMADWTARPLKKGMLEYAADDTTHLLQLHDALKQELREKGHYEWYKEECQHIETIPWEQKLPTYENLKGFTKLSESQKTIVKELYLFREQLAKKVDKPPHFIYSNKKILDMAITNPTVQSLQSMKRVHPIVKKKAMVIHKKIERANAQPQTFTQHKPLRYTLEQRKYFAQLNRIREQIAESTDLLPYVILSKDQMQHLVLDKNLDELREWQKKLVKPLLEK